MDQTIITKYEETYESIQELKRTIKSDAEAGITSIKKLQSLVELEIRFKVYSELYDIICQNLKKDYNESIDQISFL
jgi:hypothetical protein